MRTEQFLFNNENELKDCPFSCACAYACVYAATSEKEIPLRHNTSTKIFTTRGCVWPMKSLDPDHLAPKQFSKMPESSVRMILLVLVFASNFVFTWVIPIACVCARVCACTCVASENQA